MTSNFTPATPVNLPEALDTFKTEARTEEFQVDTLERAIWAARRRASVESKMQSLRDTAQAEMDRIHLWLTEALAPYQHDMDYFDALLEGYHRRELDTDPKRKTIKLPDAELVSRKQPDAWEFDEDAFIASASFKHPDLVRVKHEIDKKEAKRLLTATDTGSVIDASGEVVEGVTVTPGDVKFSVKAKA